jgi:hypothetical protein
MIPSQGACHAVFLLTRVAHLRRCPTVADWIERARNLSTFMAGALNLERVAYWILDRRLASTSPFVATVPELDCMWERADRPTLVAIARLLLETEMPAWLSAAGNDDGIALEYIPQDDMTALRWLRGDLDHVLRHVYQKLDAEGRDFRDVIGHAAEVFVLESRRKQGVAAVHVSQLSDSFGYDIECTGPQGIERIEVKAAVPKTSGGFFVTRNEYEKAGRYSDTWKLVQLVFSSGVALRKILTSKDIEAAQFLSARELCEMVPPDTRRFAWTESARVRPDHSSWQPFELTLDPAFAVDLHKIKTRTLRPR